MIRGRLWFQFSLRGFFIAIGIFAACLAWYIRQAERQRQAVAAITSAGGIVRYDAHFEVRKAGPSMRMDISVREPLIMRLLPALGADYFSHVTYVELRGESESELAWLNALPDVEYLAVPTGALNIVQRAQRLRKLRVLQVTQTALTGADRSALQNALPGCYIR